MKKQKYLPIIAAFAALILLVLIFLVQGNLNHSAEVILPEETEQHDSSGTPTDTSDETIRRVEVRPDTVQSVIETLARPENYSCTVTLERYYDGGSATSVAELRVAFPWTRIDMNEGGSVTTRHAIVGEENCYIWYGDSVKYFTSNAPFSADEELGIPTYERILHYPVTDIAVADYRVVDGQECIYVETVPDEDNYVECCCVNIQNGLLCAADRRQDALLIYHMSVRDVQTDTVGEQAFTLPDGTVLFSPPNTAQNTEED